MKALKSIAALYLLCFATGVFAQVAKKKKTSKKNTNTESVYKYVDSLPVPDKFKNESIVILGHYEKMKVIPPGTTFKMPGKTEDQVSTYYLSDVFSITRYLLQDQNALEKFSTYYFSESENGKKDITIIKKSGERNVVDLSKAISVKETYSSDIIELSFGKYKKIAMPGLEVGDMIEFSGHSIVITVNATNASNKASGGISPVADFFASENIHYAPATNSVTRTFIVLSCIVFPPALLALVPHAVGVNKPTYKRTKGVYVPEYIIHLNKKYPVVKQGYDVETPKNLLPLEYTLLNNAPKPDFSTVESNTQSMHVESENNDAVADEYFAYDNNNIPAVRYTFNLKSFEKFNMHFDCTDGKGFDDDAAKSLTKKLIKSKWKSNAITKYYEFDREAGKAVSKLDDEAKIKYFYYYYKRNFSLINYLLTKEDELTYESSMSSTKLFQIFCDHYEIPYEVAMWSSRSTGATKSSVSGDHLRWGILAHPGGKDVYITDFDAYSEYNVPHLTMYGAEVYYVKPDKNYVVRSEIFEQENDRNKMIVNSTATINEAGTGFTVKSEFDIEGELKNNNYNMVANREDFYKQYETMLGKAATENDDNEANYLDLYYYSSDFKPKEKQTAEEDRLANTVERNFELNENNKYEDFLNGQYNIETEVKDVNIESKGLSTIKSETPEAIKYSVDFAMDHTVNKVGNGAMVLDLGRLISEQLEMKNLSDRTRKNDIDVNYSKTYDYTISLTIPAGFNSMNLADFNVTVDNDLCSFISTCKEENGVLKLHCVKVYKKVHAEAADWNKMIEVMDAAAKMFQKKLLLEKP